MRTYIGSADLMPRNLDHRIEVVVPVLDAKIRQELGGVLDILLEDDSFAWLLAADGSWSRLTPARPGRLKIAQQQLMRRASRRRRRDSVGSAR
jgi:polyphosphate kinase